MPFHPDLRPYRDDYVPERPWFGAALCAAALSLIFGTCLLATLAAWM